VPACAAGNDNHALEHGGIAAVNGEGRRGDGLPAEILSARVEFPMAIIDTAIEEVRLFTAKDEDDVADHRFCGSAGREREVGSRLPAIRRRVIDVDLCRQWPRCGRRQRPPKDDRACEATRRRCASPFLA
jgi:hypothetical protein